MGAIRTFYNVYDTLYGNKTLLYDHITAKQIQELIHIKNTTVATRVKRKCLVLNRYYIERVEQPCDDTIYSIVDIYNKIKSNKGTKYKIEFVLERE